MSLVDRYGKLALITGASSGIGEAFCRSLAAQGCDLVVVARRDDRLQRLRDELMAAHGVNVYPVVVDLGQVSAIDQIAEIVRNLGRSVDILVNNAGFGILGNLEEVNEDRLLSMVDLNCRAVVGLTRRFLPAMKSQKRGAIIIVSSVVGAMPAPWFSTYSATKAFDLYFGEALHGECRGSGVDVITVLPGLTRTEFQATSGMEEGAKPRDYHSPYRSAEQVVASALGALGRKPIVVDGWFNTVAVHATRFLPRGIMLVLSRGVMKRELGI
jgi:short-subunit dehydrogenase